MLGFAEYGDPKGRPAFYFHGWPSSRLEPRPADALASRMGVRLIAPDRPGFGLSEHKPGRQLEDWPRDVGELADHLGMGNFTVIGNSGGAPYAVACAAKIPERITEVLLLCGLGRTNVAACTRPMTFSTRFALGVARRLPMLAHGLAGFFLRRMHSEATVIFPESMQAQLAECDRVALGHADWRNALAESVREAFRHGTQGTAWDGCLYARPWNFPIEKIAVPVRLWHGEQDRIVPVEMGRDYARAIPNCRATFYADEGHFSLPFNRMGEIFETVCG